MSRLIGKGGMGEVYAALDEHLDRNVAIKVLGAAVDIEPHRRRFLREARLAARLNHPNIASIHEVGDSDGRLYIVMELLEGKTLRTMMQERRLTIDECMSIARDVARALARAHAGDVIHRDIKPENIFITTPSPDVLFTKVLDFGLARDEMLRKRNDQESTATDLTGPGEACGTAGYLAPEQARGLAIDVRADVFSFGAVLYEMLTGKRAFDGRNQLQRMLAVVKSEPEPLKKLVPNIPADIEALIESCLKKAPADRYADGAALLVEVEALCRGSQRAMPIVKVGASASGGDNADDDEKTTAMPGRPVPPDDEPAASTSTSPSILSPNIDPQPWTDDVSVIGEVSSANILSTEDDAANEPPVVAAPTPPPLPRKKSEPIPYPVLTRWLTKEQRQQLKPLLLVSAGGLAVSLFIIVLISVATGARTTKRAAAAAEVAVAQQQVQAQDMTPPPPPAPGETQMAPLDEPPPPPPPEEIPSSPETASASPSPPTNAKANPPGAAPRPAKTVGFTRLPAVHESPTPAAAPAPAPPTPVAAAAPTQAKATTGVLHISGTDVMTVLVDGEYRRLNNGNVTLSCGRHRVRVGIRGEQTVDVPCGGTTTL